MTPKLLHRAMTPPPPMHRPRLPLAPSASFMAPVPSAKRRGEQQRRSSQSVLTASDLGTKRERIISIQPKIDGEEVVGVSSYRPSSKSLLGKASSRSISK